MSETKRINLDVNKNVWKNVSVYASEKETTKKDIVDMALKEFLEKRGLDAPAKS
jgi:hypothetical protein